MNATGGPLGIGSKIDSWEAQASDLSLFHNHVYFVMIYVANDAGLQTSFLSPGVRVDLTGPEVIKVGRRELLHLMEPW